MAGLIEKEIGGAQAQAMPGNQMESDGESDESDPAFQAALKFAMDALYSNGAAEQIAQQLKGAQDMASTIADVAYNIVSMTDERTQGAVPDELLALFAISILKEVADIAEAAGIAIKSSDLAVALKTMILRYLGENGADTTQLQAAMDQVNPEDFNKVGEAA
jgi:hypothetical protein